jgi:hypothetical protein
MAKIEDLIKTFPTQLRDELAREVAQLKYRENYL